MSSKGYAMMRVSQDVYDKFIAKCDKLDCGTYRQHTDRALKAYMQTTLQAEEGFQEKTAKERRALILAGKLTTP